MRGVLLSALGCVLCTSAVASADPVLYPAKGTPATYTPLTAAQSGMLMVTFLRSYAGGEDKLRLYDETSQTTYGWAINNQTSTAGTAYAMGYVSAGDQLSFDIWNSDDQRRDPGLMVSTDPKRSADGVTHAYVALTDPGVMYLNLEDLSFAGPNGYTDYDYNDMIVRMDVAAVTPVVPTPEPSAWMLLGTGVTAGCGLVRRRVGRKAVLAGSKG